MKSKERSNKGPKKNLGTRINNIEKFEGTDDQMGESVKNQTKIVNSGEDRYNILQDETYTSLKNNTRSVVLQCDSNVCRR